MKNKFKHILFSVAILGALTACEKEEDINKPILGLGGDTWTKGPIDNWLYDTFTKPYNIEVKYRWDGAELAVDKTLVPIKEEKVRPVMETVKEAWIDAYVAESNELFIKRLAPKQYVLVGSPQYNSGGTITLGEAEGGRKVTLYQLNNFEKSNRAIVKPTLKTIHHEFAHILHQNVMFSPEFQLITPSGYTSDWNNTTLTDARAAGFITTYAQAGPNEDFVEIIAMMLTEGKDGYDALVNGIVLPDPADATKSIPNTEAQSLLRRKEAIVVGYMKQVWNIDIYKLQARTNYTIAHMAPIPLSQVFGVGKQFKSITVEPSKLPGLSPEFKSVYNTSKAGLAAVGNAGRVLGSFSLILNSGNKAVLRVNYTNAAGSPFVANFNYTVATDAGGNYTFTYVDRDNNANVVGPGIVALTDYLTQNSFNLSWHYQGMDEFGGFTKSTDSGAYFYGNLGVLN